MTTLTLRVTFNFEFEKDSRARGALCAMSEIEIFAPNYLVLRNTFPSTKQHTSFTFT